MLCFSDSSVLKQFKILTYTIDNHGNDNVGSYTDYFL